MQKLDNKYIIIFIWRYTVQKRAFLIFFYHNGYKTAFSHKKILKF